MAGLEGRLLFTENHSAEGILSDLGRGLIGLFFCLALCYLFSEARKKIAWPLVLKSLIFQLAIALLVLKVPAVQRIFEWISKAFVKILSFSTEGATFLFKSFGMGVVEGPLMNFAFVILPVIVFFSALTSVLFFLGLLQKVVLAFAWLMRYTLKISGAESLAAAANIFLGQTEAPLLIKPYIPGMTRSELMCLMTGGMATIAGSVFAAYVGYLGGSDPESQVFFAKHLLTASVMSAPAAVAAAKMLVPETSVPSLMLHVNREKIGSNLLDAIANGTADGIRLAVNVAAMLLVFIAFVALVNYILMKVGTWTGANQLVILLSGARYQNLSMDSLLGILGAPVCWLLGVPAEDIFVTGQLLGQKTVLNEFYAYAQLGELLKQPGSFVHQKSVVMATYILCGFANFASIGIQIGGIGALAPSRRSELASLGFLALLGGTVASLFTAVLVGMVYNL
ncbi:MAG: Na+ dependent nucleoside transporter [Flavobacteriales bacterium]|nr:Na+ dependent nucleoside transporter [Flavobacteriales bacterium]MCX7767744.1 Na+ dependent nucleoside transporter [Flavobacteriales bacterium]MDW8409361.1 nucleoside transporter C-terminal domain-containing protein [Flavobacteriales bacterium]